MKVRIETNFSWRIVFKVLKNLSSEYVFSDGGFNQFENNFRNLDSKLLNEN